MQAWTTPRDVGVRGPLAPGPAVAERRAADVLPADHPDQRHRHSRGPAGWTVALVATVARTGWLAAVTTLAFLGGVFGATAADGRSPSSVVPWALIGGGLWLVIAATWTLLRRR
ncbi:MAG: hypothetical protein JO265_09830 [Acidimicrobiia bacterium]|nr:hypothetical protein [Acidimicrobiia bacterium]